MQYQARPIDGPEAVEVSVGSVTMFKGAKVGDQVDSLIWLGGAAIQSNLREFGEFSGISFLDADRFVMVSDKGYFLSGKIESAIDGQLSGLADTVIAPIDRKSLVSGDRPPDAEAVAVVFENGEPSFLRVGFERYTQVADYDLEDGRPVGPAVAVDIPVWLRKIETNETIEAICYAPETSPVSGNTLVIAEDVLGDARRHAALIIGEGAPQALTILGESDFNPSACTFLPGGDLLVLFRAQRDDSFAMQIRRISANQVRQGAELDGWVILEADNIGNMEGIAVRPGADGDLRLVLVSDSGGQGKADNLLLQFALPSEF